MGEKFDEVCRNIRACLNSSQRQSTLSELSRDYREVLGEPIPFKSLGYSSLESLVHAVPQLKVTKNNGELYIDVRPDEKTAHIATLVREQKNSKKKPVQEKRRNYGTSLYRPKPPPRRSYDIPVTVPKRRPPPPKTSDIHPARRPEYEKPRPKMTRSPPITISSESDSNESPRYDTRYFNSKINESYSDSDEELICQMAELQVTLGNEPRRQVSVGKNADRKNGHPITLSNEDDKGYSSMDMRKYDYNTYSNYSDEDYHGSYSSTNNSIFKEQNYTKKQFVTPRRPFPRVPSFPKKYVSKGYRGKNYNKTAAFDEKNITVTTFSGSGRGRVVAFLLR